MAYSNIDKPNEYFNTKIYAPDGSSSFAVTGVGFQPDLVWVKSRNYAEDHQLNDSVRGATKGLQSNLINAETTQANGLTSFDSDGFTVGNLSDYNFNGDSIVSWNWLAGGSASSNTDGSITSQVSANTTSGFSIVSYTGTGSAGTIGHGLGATPVMGIFKNRTASSKNWRVWHQDIANNEILELNATSAAAVPSNADFNISNNTTDVWGLEINTQSNGSGDDMIAYIFAEKKGFSKFGSYTGNGSTDGTFIYTGFKPAFVIVKMTSSTGNWSIFDNKRDSFNVVDNMIKGNDSQAELVDSSRKIDFNSSGFKIRANHADINTSGGTYIYMAFAESPLVGSNLVPNNAR